MSAIGFLILYLALIEAFNPANYTNSQELSPSVYTLHWKVDTANEYVYIAMEAQTNGWMGFGIAEPSSGSMPGADIVIGWYSEGTAHVEDRYALAKEKPEIDACQNWEVTGGEQTNGKTIIEARRRLTTGDPQDRPIVEGKTRTVWSYSSDDTINFQYHGGHRQATVITLFGPVYADPLDAIKADPSVLYFDLLNNYTLQPTVTHYQEADFNVTLDPAIEYHIIAIEAMVQLATKRYVHHFVLTGYPNISDYTVVTLWAWAPGIEPNVLPPQAGYRISFTNPDGFKKFHLQTHYDNPALVTGTVDNSGVRIYYTTTLRQYDAGVIELGDPSVLMQHPIPRGTGIMKYEYSCPYDCTASWPLLNVFGVFLHMHAWGAQIWGSHWRGGVQLNETGRVDFWDFAFQQQRHVNFSIYPGDRINTHCWFKQNSAGEVAFGLASQAEMCIQYLQYYPRLTNNNGYCAYYYEPIFEQYGLTNATLCNGDVLWDATHTLPIPDVIKDPLPAISRYFGTLGANPDFVCERNTAMNVAPHVLSVVVLFLLLLIV